MNRFLGDTAGPSTTARWARRADGKSGAVAVAATALSMALAGCTIALPAPQPAVTSRPTAAASYAVPTIQAGHNAAAVAAKNMTFDAGATLSPNVAVGFASVLDQPGQSADGTQLPPAWKLVKNNVAGETQYSNAAGCAAAYWVTSNQGPLTAAGDDKASTENLMKYLIPSVVPEALQESSLPWSSEAGRKAPSISFLAYRTKAAAGVPASMVWGRLLGTAGTGLVVSLSCPTDALLARTTPELMAKLAVAPPTS
ncbi:hypothetical protein QO003_001441 [Arthrobacter silviterrae]|uniref:Sensor domain-containing protein n=1 Tax=Arthrobacter silviterrae TaxID=2026658 RepID=A0ABX0DE84_9MICC|nr:hypothetical protein [Arthrobacter silviterrae]MDQ0277138.1 hypothetical protein [Arthrobacter silviterrae]NGN83694.1 hypothetical protein [Arthrobacter silviterrae]